MLKLPKSSSRLIFFSFSVSYSSLHLFPPDRRLFPVPMSIKFRIFFLIEDKKTEFFYSNLKKNVPQLFGCWPFDKRLPWEERERERGVTHINRLAVCVSRGGPHERCRKRRCERTQSKKRALQKKINDERICQLCLPRKMELSLSSSSDETNDSVASLFKNSQNE